MSIELSIITINYNGLNDTCELIESIPFNEKMELIVVDNASKEDEANIIANRYPQVKTIRSDKNIGFATLRADVPDGAKVTVGPNGSPATVVSKVFC